MLKDLRLNEVDMGIFLFFVIFLLAGEEFKAKFNFDDTADIDSLTDSVPSGI